MENSIKNLLSNYVRFLFFRTGNCINDQERIFININIFICQLKYLNKKKVGSARKSWKTRLWGTGRIFGSG